MIGKRLLHYRILEALGHGGMGEVYLAVDEKLDRRVALKTIPKELADDPVRRKRFERESKVLAALNHPNIVTVHAIEEVDDQAFLVMELIEGSTLADRISPAGMDEDEALEIAVPMAEALAAAHQAGVVHRDLKPENVMIRGDGLVKVVDFGLSRLESSTLAGGMKRPITDQLTREGEVVGTVHYMSPEQLEGQYVDARSDIFSLGIVLYEMLVGSKPFKGASPVSIASSILRDEPRKPASGPVRRSELVAVVRRCLRKDPSGRYQHAGELRDALREVQEAPRREVESVPGTGSPAAERETGLGRWFGLPRSATAALATLAILAVAGGLLLGPDWGGRDGNGDPSAAELRTESPERDVPPEANAAYQRGRYFLEQRTQEGFRKALEKFREALVYDPELADAHAGLAHTYDLMASYKILPPEEGFPRAREAAEAALRLDPENAQARAALAFIAHYWEWDMETAEAGFRQALELEPDNPELHNWLALLLIHTARFDEAVEHALEATRLAPLSLIAHRNAATVLYFARELELAQQYLDKTRELDPDFSNVHILQGGIHELEGRFREAEEEYLAEKSLDRGWNGIVDSLLGHLYAVNGRREKALRIATAQSDDPPAGSSPVYIAAVWIALDERDRAFSWLERAFEQKDRFLLQSRAEPRFDPVRSDPRFLELLDRVGLLAESRG